MSGGSCGTGGRDGDRAIMVVAECRLVAELMLVRGPKAGDEAGETHAVCLHLWKQLASWRSPPHPPQRTEAGDWRYYCKLWQDQHYTSGPAPKHFLKGD